MRNGFDGCGDGGRGKRGEGSEEERRWGRERKGKRVRRGNVSVEYGSSVYLAWGLLAGDGSLFWNQRTIR